MRKHIYERMTDKDSNEDLKLFSAFLKDNIELVENEKQSGGHFAVNYASNILNKKIYDISLNVTDLILLGFEAKQNEAPTPN
jgi:hypothetical protein